MKRSEFKGCDKCFQFGQAFNCIDCARCKVEKDPNGLNAKEPGSKLDAGKVEVLRGAISYFPRALLEVARVSQVGARKYSWKGWESVPNGIQRYGDALARHLVDDSINGEYDKDTGLLHAAQIAWNALARLELILREKEKNSAVHQTRT